MGVEKLLARRGGYARARSVGQDRITLLVVDQIGEHDLVQHLFVHGRVEDRQHRLDAAVEIALHEVGGSDIDMRLAMRQRLAAAKHVNARVFEKASDDGAHADVVRQARHAGPQAADAAHDKIDLHARPACRVERIDDLRIDQSVAFAPDGGRLARLGESDLFLDMLQKPRLQRQRRDRHLLKTGRLGIAGDIIEDARDIAADDGVGGEDRNVGIDARRDRMIVAGADVAVGDEPGTLAAHHHRQFGVRLQLDETEHHLRARPLQIARPADVGRLVETRLQFDERGDGFARLRRLDQRPHDGAVGRCAIQRLLDRDDVGIVRGLVKKLHDDIEGFVRVMDAEVLLPDRRQAIAAIVANALGKTGVVWLELERRPVDADEFRKVVERQHPVQHEDFSWQDFEFVGDEGAQFIGKTRVEFQTDDGTAAAALQRRLEQADEVFCLLLDFQIAVADGAKESLPLHVIAGKQPVGVHRNQGLDGDEPRPGAAEMFRQHHEATETVGNAHQTAQLAPVAGTDQLLHQGKPKVGYERKGVRRIDRQRGEHRKDLQRKMIVEPGPLDIVDIRLFGEHDVCGGQFGAQVAPALLLLVGQHHDTVADLHKLFGRRQVVLGGRRQAGSLLAAGQRSLKLTASPAEFAPVFSAFGQMAGDLSASRDALEAAQRRTEAVLQHVASGVLAVNPDGAIIIGNPRAETMLGVTLRPGTLVSQWQETAPLAPLLTRVASFLRSNSDDASFDVSINSRQLTARLTRLPAGAVLTLDDVTELASAQRVLAWGEMARQVAHEIKNPLTPIRLGVQHLRRAYRDGRGDFSDILEKNVGCVLEEIDHLDEIARAFSRYGTAPAEREAPQLVSLGDVVRTVLALESLGDSGVSWTFQCNVDAPGDKAWARAVELKEVLINLLENARLANATTVEVQLDRMDGSLRIQVVDDGGGIAAEVLPRIFEPHFSTRTSGSGLGLAISRRLIESWGGTVDVTSTVDKGTTVRILLRAAN